MWELIGSETLELGRADARGPMGVLRRRLLDRREWRPLGPAPVDHVRAPRRERAPIGKSAHARGRARDRAQRRAAIVVEAGQRAEEPDRVRVPWAWY
jgi:hypothetical protein